MKAPEPSDRKTLFVVTGPFGLLGRPFLGAVPDAVPVDVARPPADVSGFRPAVALAPVDIADAGRTAGALESVAAAAGARPVAVVHLAALTDTKGGDAAAFERVNVRGTENVLMAARGIGAAFIHVSTDYVFGGESRRGSPYLENDRPRAAPPGLYAGSKFRAENLVLEAALPRTAVARLAFPYGGSGPRPDLAGKMVLRFEEARRKKEAVTFFDDQAVCPSYIPDIVRGLILVSGRLAEAEGPPAVFHLVGERTTPHAFALLVRRLRGFEDVPVAASSVKGTSYAENLHLSSDWTRKELSWRPTPHAEALGAGGGLDPPLDTRASALGPPLDTRASALDGGGNQVYILFRTF